MATKDKTPSPGKETPTHTPVDLSPLELESDDQGRIARHPAGFVIAVAPEYEEADPRSDS